MGNGIQDLKILLQQMEPQLNPGHYVFVHLAEGAEIPNIPYLASFREPEGLTLVITQAQADELGFSYAFVASWITLQVHSALEAVGLTAAVAEALSRHQISCNVIAAYYHDHLFVPLKQAKLALRVLQNLSAEAGMD